MIKQYMKSTKEETDDFRLNLKLSLENARLENKERFEILLAELRSKDGDVNDRITRLKESLGRITFWCVCSVITFAVAWGGLTAIVATNTQKWAKLEPEHQALVADVEVLKEQAAHGKQFV
jgi:hypothetical protein